MSDRWKQEHQKLYGSSRKNQEDRTRLARKLLNRIRRTGIRPCLSDDGLAFITRNTDANPNTIFSDRDLVLLDNLMPEIELLLTNERVDGHLGSVCLVFLEECSFYNSCQDKTYTFPFGAVRVVEKGLARKLVEFGSAVYHPGPKD